MSDAGKATPAAGSGDAVLVGYFAKKRTPRPDWLECPFVEEICSVSECMAPGAEDWIQTWAHNVWGFFDSPEGAWNAVPETQRPDFDLFAYELLPVRFVGGKAEPLDVRAGATAPLDPSCHPLGYDVVSRGTSDFFECSPLSCNNWAAEVGANAYCLIDDLDEALRLASVAEESRVEPGDYHVMRVWRREGT